MGTGGYLILFAAAVLYLFFREKEKRLRVVFVWLPVVVFAVFFCPVWGLYFKFRDDGEILFRLLWLLPVALVVPYAMVRLIGEIPDKFKAAGTVVSFAVLILFGKYMYTPDLFPKAENIYHVPETVVKICDEIKVEGREVRACFPEEFVVTVRQYSPYIHLTFGREIYKGSLERGVDAMYILRKDPIDTEELVKVLKETDTPYLIVKNDRVFDENPWKYDFCFVTEIDGYDIYLDNNAYLGLDYINYR